MPKPTLAKKLAGVLARAQAQNRTQDVREINDVITDQTTPTQSERDIIRGIFLAHGFTVKEGETDLKPYVYSAAMELVNTMRGAPPIPLSVREFEEWLDQNRDANVASVFHDIVAQYTRAAQASAANDFETVWSEFEQAGFRYGKDALEQVEFGFKIAQGLRPDHSPHVEPINEPETTEEVLRRERERAPWVLPKDPTLPEGHDWRIDTSAGRPILVYKNCSVIEAEDAEYVLRLIAADRASTPVADDMAEAVKMAKDDRAMFPASTVRKLWELKERYRLALASAPVAGEAIYQIKLPGDTESGWHDATEKAYWTATEKTRRIVYATPQTDTGKTVLQADQGVSAPRPALAVWYGSMPESNGKENYTAILHRAGDKVFDGPHMTIDRSEYPDRVRYEADRMRYLIGERTDEPCILDYDANKRSAYRSRTDLLDFLVRSAGAVESLALGNGTRYRVWWPDPQEHMADWHATPEEAIRAAMDTQKHHEIDTFS